MSTVTSDEMPHHPSPTRDDISLRERAYQQLSDLLASGSLAPGDKLSLRAAAEALGVSVMPVREAVSRLIADNALEVTPNRAVRVPVMTKEVFRDLTHVRMMIEGHAAGAAAVHRLPAELQAIRNADAHFRAQSLSSRPDVSRAVALNRDFHFAIYAAAHSPALLGIIRGLWLKAGPVITLNVRGKPARLANISLALHVEALRAIEARDATAASSAIAQDIESAANYILEEGGLPD